MLQQGQSVGPQALRDRDLRLGASLNLNWASRILPSAREDNDASEQVQCRSLTMCVKDETDETPRKSLFSGNDQRPTCWLSASVGA